MENNKSEIPCLPFDWRGCIVRVVDSLECGGAGRSSHLGRRMDEEGCLVLQAKRRPDTPMLPGSHGSGRDGGVGVLPVSRG